MKKPPGPATRCALPQQPKAIATRMLPPPLAEEVSVEPQREKAAFLLPTPQPTPLITPKPATTAIYQGSKNE